MPSATNNETLTFHPMHPTFGAVVEGMNWELPTPQSLLDEVTAGAQKYGVLVFRNANLDNAQHIAFTRQLGDLEDVSAHIKAGRKMRFPEQPEIFDVANLDENGKLLTEAEDKVRKAGNKGNMLWHADMAYNPQRVSYSLLRAVELPPPGSGGETEYLDSRTAYEDLPAERKERLETLIANNSLFHNRKLAAPDVFGELEPLDQPMARHRLIQTHEGSGRKNLYITSYAHHFDGETLEQSKPLIDELINYVSQDKYKLAVPYENNGDLVFWDNRAVLHRATPMGSYDGRHRRDMRRTSVKDDSPTAWGENGVGCSWQAGLSK